MAELAINDTGVAQGDIGFDRVTFTSTVPGGVTLTALSGDLAQGYKGVFIGPESNSGAFEGIEALTFKDQASSNDSIASGDGDDHLYVSGGDDTISAGGGNDVIDAGFGSDFIHAQDGNDTVVAIPDGQDSLSGGDGIDVLQIIGADKALTMTSGKTVTSDSGALTYVDFEQLDVTGSGLADKITLGSGSDTAYGGDGNDTIATGAGSDSIDGGLGDDLITVVLDGSDTIDGSEGNDTLVLQSTAALVMTESSKITAGSATVELRHIENTVITGSDHNDQIIGQSGQDFVESGGGDDTVSGGEGNDTLNSGIGSDSISGGEGNDVIQMLLGGSDVVDGGGGIDSLLVTGALSAVTMAPSGSIATASGTIIATNVENYNVTGSVEADSLESGQGNDSLFGGNGSDTLSAGEGSDSIDAGNGDDRLRLTLGGQDFVDGGLGNDILYLTAGTTGIQSPSGTQFRTEDGLLTYKNVEHFHITGSNQNDTISSGIGNDTLVGGDGNDVLDVKTGVDQAYGGGGNDRVLVRVDGNDTVEGGGGYDVLIAWGSRTAVTMTDGTTISSSSGVVNYSGFESLEITGAVQGDLLHSGSTSDVLDGRDGNDTLMSGTGSDRLYGGSGNDHVTVVLDGIDVAYGGDGIDTLVVQAGSLAIFITDTTITAAGVRLTYDNFEFFDITGSQAGDNITGGAGKDALSGSTGNDTLNGGDGSDQLFGGFGDDRLIVAMNGLDQLFGGIGRDTAVIVGATSAVTFDGLVGGSGLVSGTGQVELSDIEQVDITGSSMNDSLTANDGNDRLGGLAGDDVLSAGQGSDTIDGGEGADLITLSLDGLDTVFGGAGIDTLYINNLASGTVRKGVTAGNLAGGYSGIIEGPASSALSFAGIEQFNLIDTSGSPVEFTAGDGNDTIATGTGADVINAGNGANRVETGAGNDSIIGGAGADSLFGGEGNDTINSGFGFDSVSGGAGADVWVGDLSALETGIFLDGNSGTFSGSFGTVTEVEGFQITTGSGSDTLVGHRSSAVDDRFSAGAGDDSITLISGGKDTVDGGAGTDVLYVEALAMAALRSTGVRQGPNGFRVTYEDTAGNAVAVTNVETLHITGSDLGDWIIAGDGNDSLFGGAGNDTLSGGNGIDSISGGDGLDLWALDFSGSSKGLSLDINRSNGNYALKGKYSSIEGLNLTSGAGSDSIKAHETSALNDFVNTGRGNDTMELWMGGSDEILGGAGADRLILNGTGVTLVVTGVTRNQGGNGLAKSDLGQVQFSGIDSFTFNGTGGGDDKISTSQGSDRLYGENGNDYLSGGAGTDWIDGGIGNDTIKGGSGTDFLTGGQGNDVFAYSKAEKSGLDQVKDFQNGVDKILIKGATFSSLKITATGRGHDTKITMANGSAIVLEDITKSQITAADFLFA